MNNLTTQQIFWDLINFSKEEQSAGVDSTEKPGVGSQRARGGQLPTPAPPPNNAPVYYA